MKFLPVVAEEMLIRNIWTYAELFEAKYEGKYARGIWRNMRGIYIRDIGPIPHVCDICFRIFPA